MACDLTSKALDGPRHLVYLTIRQDESEKRPFGRGAAQPEYNDAYQRRGESTKRIVRDMAVSVHTGELGLRIAWNCWRNDEYADGSLVLCQLCRHVVKIGGDQHRRSSVRLFDASSSDHYHHPNLI